MPATVLAVRQSQIAERKMQVETAEARQLWQESGKESRTVQVLLATHTGDRDPNSDEGIERGKAVLERYAVSARDPG